MCIKLPNVYKEFNYNILRRIGFSWYIKCFYKMELYAINISKAL